MADSTQSQSTELAKDATASASAPATGMQKYLDKAVKVLGQFNLADKEDTNNQLIRLLDDVKHLDEPKVLAISLNRFEGVPRRSLIQRFCIFSVTLIRPS